MTISKELRKQRRREEHQARKAANRAGLPSVAAEPAKTPAGQPRPVQILSEELDFNDPENISFEAFKAHYQAHGVIRTTEIENGAQKELAAARGKRNRRNAQLSTGPKTAAGKARASQNAIRHGLSSDRFLVFEWENLDEFHDLLLNLRAEHQPATQTEALLVEKMAQHFWLSQRALRLQDMCFNMEVPLCEQPKEMALYMRYETTHERAFHKCGAELTKLRATQRKEQAGFVSQQRQAAAECRKQELHNVRIASAKAKTPAAICATPRPASIQPEISPLPAVAPRFSTPVLPSENAASQEAALSRAA
jgi:hypothetical protein